LADACAQICAALYRENSFLQVDPAGHAVIVRVEQPRSVVACAALNLVAVVSFSEDKPCVHLFPADAAQHTACRVLQHDARIYCAALVPENVLALGDARGRVVLVALPALVKTTTLWVHADPVCALAPTASGSLVVLASGVSAGVVVDRVCSSDREMWLLGT
jgi:hypothetical protein